MRYQNNKNVELNTSCGLCEKDKSCLSVNTQRQISYFHFVHDALSILDYQTYAITSPPTFFWRASLSVIRPSEVEMIAIPSPLRTLGTSSRFE